MGGLVSASNSPGGGPIFWGKTYRARQLLLQVKPTILHLHDFVPGEFECFLRGTENWSGVAEASA